MLSLCFSIAQVRMSMSCSFTMHYHCLGFLFWFGLLQCPFVVHHCVIAMQIPMIPNVYPPNTSQVLGEKTMVGIWSWNDVEISSVDVNAWIVKTLKGNGWEAWGAKIRNGYSSSKNLDVESWCVVFFFVFWVYFCLFADLWCLIFVLQSSWEMLNWCWWWSGFVVAVGGVLEWKCGSRSWTLVGATNLVKMGEDWTRTI